jgi:hypothetical protein
MPRFLVGLPNAKPVSIIRNDANLPVAIHFNTGNHSVSDMEIRALCLISGSNDSRKRHEMCLIPKLGTVHSYGINERFSYVLLCLSSPVKADIDNVVISSLGSRNLTDKNVLHACINGGQTGQLNIVHIK